MGGQRNSEKPVGDYEATKPAKNKINISQKRKKRAGGHKEIRTSIMKRKQITIGICFIVIVIDKSYRTSKTNSRN